MVSISLATHCISDKQSFKYDYLSWWFTKFINVFIISIFLFAGEICGGQCCGTKGELMLKDQAQEDFANMLKYNSRILQGSLSSISDTLQSKSFRCLFYFSFLQRIVLLQKKWRCLNTRNKEQKEIELISIWRVCPIVWGKLKLSS